MASAIDEVSDHERRRWKAMLAADVAALDELLGKEMAYVHSNGRLDDRESYLDSFRSGQSRFTKVDGTIDHIIMDGDGHALVISEMAMAAPERAVSLRTTAVWVRAGAGWRLISSCSTRL